MTLRHTIRCATLLVALTLSACGGPGPAQPTEAPPAPTDLPTAAPTAAAPAPTAAPAATASQPTAVAGGATAAPVLTPLPASDEVLPSALYTLRAGQIYRIERDGVAQTQITYEVPFQADAVAVTDFAVSPAGNALAYTVQRPGSQVLVLAGPNGEDPAPRFDRADVGPSDPLFTPDGQFVAVRLTALPQGAQGLESGLYLIPVAGGEPRLLVADETSADPAAPGYGHAPEAFSPDGARLLTNRFALAVELCDLAVVALADGAAVPLQAPAAPEGEQVTTCGAGAWSPDSASFYFIPVRIGADPGATGIWRADPATGASFPLTPQPGGPPFTLYASPGVAADGSLYAFTAEAEQLPEPFSGEPTALAYTMARIGPADGLATALRPAEQETPLQVLWEPSGRGAVALLVPDVGDPGLWWLPADGGQATLLLGATTDLFRYEWAAPQRSAG